MKIVSKKIIKLEEPVPVYDLTVEGTHNFKLAVGPFVHNSKDTSDGVAGSIHLLFTKEAIHHMRPMSSQRRGTRKIRMGETTNTRKFIRHRQ